MRFWRPSPSCPSRQRRAWPRKRHRPRPQRRWSIRITPLPAGTRNSLARKADAAQPLALESWSITAKPSTAMLESTAGRCARPATRLSSPELIATMNPSAGSHHSPKTNRCSTRGAPVFTFRL